MNLDLSGQIALVTGASRGIGQAIADELVKCGAKVIGTTTRLVGSPPAGIGCPSFSYTITEQALVAEQFNNGK